MNRPDTLWGALNADGELLLTTDEKVELGHVEDETEEVVELKPVRDGETVVDTEALRTLLTFVEGDSALDCAPEDGELVRALKALYGPFDVEPSHSKVKRAGTAETVGMDPEKAFYHVTFNGATLVENVQTGEMELVTDIYGVGIAYDDDGLEIGIDREGDDSWNEEYAMRWSAEPTVTDLEKDKLLFADGYPVADGEEEQDA